MEEICADPGNPIEEVHTVDLRQSMRNGGGPACLRLRVPMTQHQLAAVTENVRVVADEELFVAVEKIIHAHYPDTLTQAGLGEPELYHQSRAMLEALGEAMKLSLL